MGGLQSTQRWHQVQPVRCQQASDDQCISIECLPGGRWLLKAYCRDSAITTKSAIQPSQTVSQFTDGLLSKHPKWWPALTTRLPAMRNSFVIDLVLRRQSHDVGHGTGKAAH